MLLRNDKLSPNYTALITLDSAGEGSTLLRRARISLNYTAFKTLYSEDEGNVTPKRQSLSGVRGFI
jgi:hypothetical protein